jgi:hypothetical protein
MRRAIDEGDLVIWTTRPRFRHPGLGCAGNSTQSMCGKISRIYLVAFEMKKQIVNKDLLISNKVVQRLIKERPSDQKHDLLRISEYHRHRLRVASQQIGSHDQC